MNRKYVPILVALLLPAAAWAQAEGIEFEALDANGDGTISMDEAQANQEVAASFSEADSNSDGSLSEDEFQVAFAETGGAGEAGAPAGPSAPNE